MFDDVSNLRQLESIAIMCYNKASVTRCGMCIQQTPSGENITRFPWKGLNQGQKEMLMSNVQLPLIDREYVQISAKKKISILFPFVFLYIKSLNDWSLRISKKKQVKRKEKKTKNKRKLEQETLPDY